jgi:hypothetical protein
MGVTQNLFSSSAGSVAVIALTLAVVALVGVVFLLARQQRLLGQYQQLMAGASGGNLEQVLNEHVDQMRRAVAHVSELGHQAQALETAAHFHLQHVGMVRYNPFRDTGGDQSFALVMADGRGHGFVLSSLHTRDVTRVYAKPLAAWESSYSLTDEERQAISQARLERS